MVVNKYVAESIGTFVLVLLGSMTILAAGEFGLVMVPLGFGLALTATVFAFGHVSGGHFNPAVSLALYLDRRLDTTDLIGYWVAQFFGGILASLILLAVTTREAVTQTATSYPALRLGIMSELVLTTVLALVYLAATRRAPASLPFAVGLTYAAVHFAGLPFSGASVNPARSFGPAVVGGAMSGLWVYLLFPLVGALVAWGIWQFVDPAPVRVVAEDGGADESDDDEPGPPAEPPDLDRAP